MLKILYLVMCTIQQDRQRTCNVTLRHVHVNIFAVEKQWVLHNQCVSGALGIQDAMQMCRIVTCGVPFSTFFHIIS